MKRTGKIKWGNMKVGILVTFALALILYSSFQGGGTTFFAPKKQLVAYFHSVNGLLDGAPVRLAGVEVGNVKSIKFVNLDDLRRLRVEVNVKESVWKLITEGSRVQLGTIGLLGDKYIEIYPGPPDNPILESGSEIAVIEEVGLDAIVRKPPEVTNSIDSILLNLRDITEQVARSEGTIGRVIADTSLYTSLVSALEQTSNVMSEFNANQRKIMKKLDATLENTASLTDKIDRGEGSLGKLVSNDQLYSSLSRSSSRLDSILAKVDRGDGSAGALINDAQLYEEIRNLVARINSLVADIEENPRKYFKFSVF